MDVSQAGDLQGHKKHVEDLQLQVPVHLELGVSALSIHLLSKPPPPLALVTKNTAAFLYASEECARKELLLFLLNLRAVWPLTSIAAGLHPELGPDTRQIPSSWVRRTWLQQRVVGNRCNSAAFPPVFPNFKRISVRCICWTRTLLLQNPPKMLTNIFRPGSQSAGAKAALTFVAWWVLLLRPQLLIYRGIRLTACLRASPAVLEGNERQG